MDGVDRIAAAIAAITSPLGALDLEPDHICSMIQEVERIAPLLPGVTFPQESVIIHKRPHCRFELSGNLFRDLAVRRHGHKRLQILRSLLDELDQGNDGRDRAGNGSPDDGG